MSINTGGSMDSEIGPWVDEANDAGRDGSIRLRRYTAGTLAALVDLRILARPGARWLWLARPPGVPDEVDDAGRAGTAPTREDAERQADAALDEIARGGE